MAKATLAGTVEELDDIIDAHDIRVPEKRRDEYCQRVLWVLKETISRAKRGPIVMVDFDDMIWLPLVLAVIPRQYDRVFVDETQDLNASQQELVLKAIKPKGRICLIGDRNQAIYGFRGADVESMSRLITDLHATVLPLSTTYRCGKAIARLAQDVVPQFEAHESNADGEIREVTYQDLIADVKPGEFVISRKNAPLIKLCFNLWKANKKAQIMGKDLGLSLVQMIEGSGCLNIQAFMSWIEDYTLTEIQRLSARKHPNEARIEHLEDQLLMFEALCEGITDLAALRRRVESLFTDDGKTGVRLMSTHKSKGLEADTCWILTSTYKRGHNQEEDNLWYVAVTRARMLLCLASDDS